MAFAVALKFGEVISRSRLEVTICHVAFTLPSLISLGIGILYEGGLHFMLSFLNSLYEPLDPFTKTRVILLLTSVFDLKFDFPPQHKQQSTR